jgi:Cu2+-exporting ATPase
MSSHQASVNLIPDSNPSLSTAVNLSAGNPLDETCCFHCGLPIPPKFDSPHLTVLGSERFFCCHGCYAVCKAINDAGHEEFYRYREQQDGLNKQVLPSILQDLKIYDRPEVQAGFVRTSGDTREAALILENISCAACLWLNEQHLRAQPGIIDVHLNYASHQARVKWDPECIQLSDILQAIAAIGYIAHPYDPARRERLLEDERRRSIERLIFAGLLGWEVMMFSVATYWMGGYNSQGKLALWEIIGRWTALIVTFIMLIYSGADFFVGAWRDLKNSRLGMDVPVILGLTTAWLGSLWATIVNEQHVYFDSISMFIFFVLLARVVEVKGRMAAADAMDRLMKIIPRTACRVESGIESEVPVMDLRIGDTVCLHPGDSVPVDGLLLDSASSFDESHLTGESVPVYRKKGEWIYAGSCNVDQSVLMQVERVSTDSTLNELQRLMDQGLSAKPKIAEFAERVSVPFVLGTLVLAVLTAIVWWFINPSAVLPNTISVLIITCPCALALATPVALAISSGRFATLGLMPMRMAAMDSLASADTLLLDKTGSLTQGCPSLTAIRTLGDLSETQARAIAATMERHSEHPLAKALRDGSKSLDDDIVIKNHLGQGVEMYFGEHYWRLGAPLFTLTRPLSADDEIWLKNQMDHGGIVVILSCDGVAQALFVLHDTLREGATIFVKEMIKLGMKRIVILSGDQYGAVAHLAEQIGISEFYAEMKPQDKLTWISSIQKEGANVLMVGDGINDAPTLAAAQASISFGSATNLAQIHSDFVLLGTDLRVLSQGMLLARHTRRNIRQNLAWAAGYNLVAVPLAAMGFITPWLAAIGMSLSSLFVVGNALRLRQRKKFQMQHILKEG